jgi:hypothetical protein
MFFDNINDCVSISNTTCYPVVFYTFNDTVDESQTALSLIISLPAIFFIMMVLSFVYYLLKTPEIEDF